MNIIQKITVVFGVLHIITAICCFLLGKNTVEYLIMFPIGLGVLFISSKKDPFFWNEDL